MCPANARWRSITEGEGTVGVHFLLHGGVKLHIKWRWARLKMSACERTPPWYVGRRVGNKEDENIKIHMLFSAKRDTDWHWHLSPGLSSGLKALVQLDPQRHFGEFTVVDQMFDGWSVIEADVGVMATVD